MELVNVVMLNDSIFFQCFSIFSFCTEVPNLNAYDHSFAMWGLLKPFSSLNYNSEL